MARFTRWRSRHTPRAASNPRSWRRTMNSQLGWGPNVDARDGSRTGEDLSGLRARQSSTGLFDARAVRHPKLDARRVRQVVHDGHAAITEGERFSSELDAKALAAHVETVEHAGLAQEFALS